MLAVDSKVTIDWISDKANLDLIYLSHWKDKISSLKKGFETLNFMHIHGQFNKITDSLSKKALKDKPGWLYFEENVNGTIIRDEKLHIL
jgi:hypothetical protein